MVLNLPKTGANLFPSSRDLGEGIQAKTTPTTEDNSSFQITAGNGIDIVEDEETRTVTIKVKGEVWSCPGSHFMPENPDTDEVRIISGGYISDGTDLKASAAVFLPNGAVVTSVIVYGDGTWTWEMFRSDNDSVDGSMASANNSTEDTSISNATIDNETYSYRIDAVDLDSAADAIYLAVIKYT